MWLLRKVRGHSMAPYLRDGQFVLAGTNLHRTAEGKVVLAWHDGREIVKFVGRHREGKTELLGKDSHHNAGWVDNESIRAVVIWPRIVKKGWVSR